MIVLYVLGYFNRNKQNSYAALILRHNFKCLKIYENLSLNICQCFRITGKGIFYCEQLVIRGDAGANKNTKYPPQSTSVF